MIYVHVPSPAGTIVIFNHNTYIEHDEHKSFLHESRNPASAITQTRLPFVSQRRLIVTVLPRRNNSNVTSAWRDRDTSHRNRKNWNIVAIDPTSIARAKKRLDITARWARIAKVRLPVTPVIPWMYHRQGKVSSFKLLYFLNYV